jgi:ectoine hydroxylase-related dioxygenase (phytanoyl-CoA dioxygenase family)
MLSEDQVRTYREQGYIVVPDVLTAEEVAGLRAATDEVVAGAAEVSGHTAVYDLEPGHRPDAPKVRRINNPHAQHPAFGAMVRHPKIVACLNALWGPNVRFDISKLNMKSPGYGSPVEWHQDWAFYPHTNDDLAAVGIMIDDATPENGPMLMLPGTHKGPVYDHKAGGYFVGGIDAVKAGLNCENAQPCLGKAGSITIHHVRMVHGSAANVSDKPRRFMLLQYRAADAWPLLVPPTMNFAAYGDLLVSGEETWEPRMEKCPVRLGFPYRPDQFSIYENQTELENKYFAAATAHPLVNAGR